MSLPPIVVVIALIGMLLPARALAQAVSTPAESSYKEWFTVNAGFGPPDDVHFGISYNFGWRHFFQVAVNHNEEFRILGNRGKGETALNVSVGARVLSMLPPGAREQVRTNTPEVQSEYSTRAPQPTARSARLSDVLQVGANLEWLYQICGEPDAIKRKARVLFRSLVKGAADLRSPFAIGKSLASGISESSILATCHDFEECAFLAGVNEDGVGDVCFRKMLEPAKGAV